jgi:signal transduction histidine kinase
MRRRATFAECILYKLPAGGSPTKPVRRSLKAVFIVLVGYAALIAALALGINDWMRSVEDTTGRAAATLLAREKLALLTAPSLRALSSPDPVALSQLRRQVQTASGTSGVISSLAIVDSLGRVVAGTGSGGDAPRPFEVFPKGREVLVEPLGGSSFFRGAPYVVSVPLENADGLVGYFRVVVNGDSTAIFYEKARRRLLAIALLVFLGTGLLGLLLQYQIARGAASIARALEDGAPAPSLLSGADEFKRTLVAATRVREALNEARRESGRLHHGFSALAQVMKVGVLRSDGRQVSFANPRALEFFGVSSLGELSLLLSGAGAALEPLFGNRAPHSPGSSIMLDLPTRTGKRTLRVERYRLEEYDEYLLLLNDPHILETLETDVRLASQLEGVARTYRTVAHELKAPLSAVMINLDLLRESLVDPNSGDSALREERNRYVTILGDEFARLNRSLANLLTQTAPSNQPPKPFDLKELVAELGTLLAPQARRQGVDLGLDVPEAALRLVGYRDRLKQALLNICVNALEAMAMGGRMTIEVRQDGDRVRVSVRDTGAGIDPELLPRIYESDFTTKGAGSGIGLYVARSLVEMHGGTIRVESRAGEGARVDVELPLSLGS